MKNLGYMLVIVGFLAGSLAAVLNKTQVKWDWFVAALAVGSAGLVVVRSTRKRETQSQARITCDIEIVEASLARIVRNISQINTEKHSIDTYDVRHRIDQLFTEDLSTFVNARQSITHSCGLGAYADVMGPFAAGERYLNRVWSASADGYIDEVNTYLEKAKDQFVESLAKLRSSKSGSIAS